MPSLSSEPFPHIIDDHLFHWWEEIHPAFQSWPAPDWPGWHAVYDSQQQRKRACDRWADFPAPIARLLCRMLTLPLPQWFGLDAVPDGGLYGAGMHSIISGGMVQVHLDHDRHPRLDLERKATAILYLSTLEEGDGGQLELWPSDDTGPVGSPTLIRPGAGRLVAFPTTDRSYHAVRPVAPAFPPGLVRASLAVYFYGPPTGQPERPRAKFVTVGA